jgi:hypothetical protein
MLSQQNEIFIIDANVLITPYNAYYSFEFAPVFWEKMAQHIELKNILILDKVFDEIVAKEDLLSAWIKKIRGLEQISHKKSQIIENYGNIIKHIENSGFYNSIALNDWSKETKADPWIIATAMTYNYTVITFEDFNHGLHINQPSKNPKIPNICQHFSIKWANLFYMMNQLKIRL